MPQCAADKVRTNGVRCKKQGRWPAAMQPTVLIPDPVQETVCTWHRLVTVPARRPASCPCCERPF